MLAQVQQSSSQQKDLNLDFFRKDSRFPRGCTSITAYLSPWHFIGKRPSKRREVNIWLTIMHSMDSLVQWDQRIWDGDMAKAKVEMGSNTACDRNVENHATEIRRCQHQRVCQKQNQNLPVTNIWYYLSLIVVFNNNVQPQYKFCVGSSWFAYRRVHSWHMSVQSELSIYLHHNYGYTMHTSKHSISVWQRQQGKTSGAAHSKISK